MNSTSLRFVAALMIFGWTADSVLAQPPGNDLSDLQDQCFDLGNDLAEARRRLISCAKLETATLKEPDSRERNLALAKVWNRLLGGELAQGRYTAAESHGRKALAVRRRLLGVHHIDVAESLSNLALVLEHQGKYEEAESLHRQALLMMQKLLGPDHPDVGTMLNNLGVLLSSQGKYEQAEKFHRQALLMRRTRLGDEHSDVAASLNSVADALESRGKYQEAEPLHRQALAMRQKLFGTTHPDVARSLTHLGKVLQRQGKDAQAEQLHRQALSIRQELLGTEHPDVAESLNNLAVVLNQQGRYPEAENFFRQALIVLGRVFGSRHPFVASSLNNLAFVLQKQGKYDQAGTLHQQARSMHEGLLGKNHPLVAVDINNQALLLSAQGKYEQAERLHRRALSMRQYLLGPDHPEVATSFNHLATLLVSRDKVSSALPLFAKSAQIREKILRATASETRVRSALDLWREEEDTLYGLLLKHPLNVRLRRLALTTVLLRKGRAAEAGMLANRVLHETLDDRLLQERFESWRATHQEREALLFGGAGKMASNDYQDRLAALARRADDLESQLAAQLPGLRNLQPPAFESILGQVAAQLPNDAVLVEVIWVQPRQFKARGAENLWQAPHFIALLLFPDQSTVAVDLGLATEVDQLGQGLLAAMRNPASAPLAAAQAMRQKVFAPLLPYLSGKTNLFLSLDGSLNLVPFDALHDGKDYLLGRYRFQYVTSGRDLLRRPSTRISGPALVLGNPDFGTEEQPRAAVTLYQRLTLQPIPASEQEAIQIASLAGVQPLLGTAAAEPVLHQAKGPRILHLATHGFILRDVAPSSPNDWSSRSGLVQIAPQPSAADEPIELPGGVGIMNHGALAFAGVRQGQKAQDTERDGLLTEEEVRSLDLDGTQLVTLSACETGLGSPSAGQGVYGFRRAFMVAGAETLVTSLWRVDDKATYELMNRYYTKLLEPSHPADRLGAMLGAMQALRKTPERSHPYYWAPFLVIGQDGPLRGPGTVSPVRQPPHGQNARESGAIGFR